MEQKSGNRYDRAPMAKPDSIFGVQEEWKKALAAYKALPKDHPDAAPEKIPISLVIGAYRSDEGKPWVLPVVADIEREMLGKEDHEYLPMDGHQNFRMGAQKLLFGANRSDIATIQTLSGTGALCVGFTFLMKYCGPEDRRAPRIVLLSSPTWGNHRTVAEAAGFVTADYPYYNNATNSVRFEDMLQSLRTCDPHAVVVLHPSAHNPTGMDLTHEQWEQLAQVFRSRPTLVPFFDSAYQGYASGDLDADVSAIRTFVAHGLPVVVAQSFSKNLGLYGERVGALHVLCANPNEQARVQSQLKAIVRATYSNPPSYGARIAAAVLYNPQHPTEWPARFEQWKGCLSIMTERLKLMRTQLQAKLEELETPGRWNHLTVQQGMFSYTGLTKNQVQYMAAHHKIYMLDSGRMSIAGLNSHNVERVARAMKDAILHAPPM